ncbi:MAG: redoxin domain-containing protein, partial [Chloroflexota bacterium]
FGQAIFNPTTEDGAAAVNVQITPVDPDEVDRSNFFDETDIAGAVQVGQPAPNFTLVDLDGNTHTLESLQGKPVIVNFWATWCAPCRVEMPEFEEAFADYAADDLIILAVNREETPDVVEEFFVNEMGLTFTPLLDNNAQVAERYGVFNMPTTYFVDLDGNVSDVHRGPLARVQLDGYLEKIIN